jgi:hypothetical protein
MTAATSELAQMTGTAIDAFGDSSPIFMPPVRLQAAAPAAG